MVFNMQNIKCSGCIYKSVHGEHIEVFTPMNTFANMSMPPFIRTHEHIRISTYNHVGLEVLRGVNTFGVKNLIVFISNLSRCVHPVFIVNNYTYPILLLLYRAKCSPVQLSRGGEHIGAFFSGFTFWHKPQFLTLKY